MDKHYLINQPPIAKKYTFLVDDISDKVNYGLTTDIKKIDFNRELMGEYFNIDVKVALLMSESEGSTFVFDLGHFITVLEIRTDLKEGKMAFYRCEINVPKDELKPILIERYSEKIAIEWFKIYDYLHADLSSRKDNVQIHKPDF